MNETSQAVPSVAVIVIGWNNKKLLDECFASVAKQTYPRVKTIYVDNGSADGSVEYVREKHPNVEVIDTGKNNGFAVGNNIGIKEAFKDESCQYVVALNSDATLDPEWISKIVDFAKKHEDAACLQGLTLNYYNHELVDSIGIYVDMNAAPLQLGYNKPYDGSGSKEVFGVNAAAALYTRIFLDKHPYGSDYFDHDLFMYYEDVDISARALTMGMKNYFVSDALAYHMGSASSGGNPKFMLTMVHRNLPLVMIKNFPISIYIKTLPGWMKAEFERVLHFIRTKQYGLAKAIVLGRLRGLVYFPKFILKRWALVKRGEGLRATYNRLMQP